MTDASDSPARPGLGLKPGDRHYRAYVGPPENYDLLSAIQFCLLTRLGLRDHHHVLDVGCGSLRAGRLLIPYLLPHRYCGLEPEAWLIEAGIEREIGRDLVRLKQPRFAHNRDFDFTVFERRFDFIMAQSVLTHAGRGQVHRCFASAAECLAPAGIFAVTYIRGREDHNGEGWVYPNLTRYTGRFMDNAIRAAGLQSIKLAWPHPGVVCPIWLAVGHPGFADRLPAGLAAV